MREMAYLYSEGRMLRWLTLMAADRVNMIEDIVNDLAHGHIPNIPKEMGIRSELRYNPAWTRQEGSDYRARGRAGGCVPQITPLLTMS
jgi:hypothetical protein